MRKKKNIAPSVVDEEQDLSPVVVKHEENLPISHPDYRDQLPAVAGAVVPSDPLRTYLREISKYKRLSSEEERELAKNYKEYGDLEAAYKLTTSNLWLVVKIARAYQQASFNLLDLIQEGNLGLMDAVKNFDPYHEVKFPSYAVWWIKAYIIRFVIANIRLVKIGTTQAQRKLFFNLNKEKERLEREGFSPAPKLIADRLNVKEQEVWEMEQRLGAPDVSFDMPVSVGSSTTVMDILPSDNLSAEQLLADKQKSLLTQKKLKEFAKTLNKNEQIIFKKRLLNEKKVTLFELAEELMISGERVRQVEAKVLEKLKAFMLDCDELVEMYR